MPHWISPEAQAANDAPDTSTHDLLTLTLPASGDREEVVLRLGTGEISIGDDDYDPAIRAMPEVTHSAGRNLDGGTFTIDNLANLYGPIFLDTARALDGAQVSVLRTFLLADGTWEAYELDFGVLRTQPISETEVKGIFISSMSDPSIMIGDDEDSQDCGKIFNINGTHPLGGPCGWQPAQGGPPTFCSLIFDDGVNGCLAHNNQGRFGGTPRLKPNAAAEARGPIITSPDPWDDGYGPGRRPYRSFPDFDVDATRLV